MNTLADIQGEGKQVVAPGSIHPNGNTYLTLDDSEIAFIPYSELKALIMPFDCKPKKEKNETAKVYIGLNDKTNFADVVKSKVRLEEVLRMFGVDTAKNPTNCPLHSSKGGKCLGWNSETWHCFHCEESGNIFSLVMKFNNCDFKDCLLWFADKLGLQQDYDECKKKYVEKLKIESKEKDKNVKFQYLSLISGKEKRWADATELLRDFVLSKVKIFTTKDDLKSEMWIYQDGIYIPQGKSEVKKILRDLLEEHYSVFVYNKVIEKIEPDTFIEAEKFFSQNYKYKLPVENGILDIFNLKLLDFDFSQIFFNKLPVKYNPNAKCPKIEQFLKSVLAKEEDVKVFYEMAGFALLKDYTFEKAFMLVGGGRNGKGKSIELIKRLVGIENSCSVPLVSLLPDSFNISELFGKLVNLAGDIGSQDLKDTSMFKALTGRDLIGGKRKFQRNINFQNYAKFVFACNELPMVYDLSKGFWDRWILLEYPHTFVTQDEYDKAPVKDNLKIRDPEIIDKITTPEELSGLLNEALNALHRLLEEKKFSATRGTEEVKSMWIRKSNSFIAFCYDNLEEKSDGIIYKKELRKKYSEYCKFHQIPAKSDFVIKKVLQETYGSTEERRNPLGDVWDWVWVGVKWKN
jgi:putative DNA primase/helicase